MHQKPDQVEEARWEGQNFSEVVVLQEEEEEEVSLIYVERPLASDFIVLLGSNSLEGRTPFAVDLTLF